jgi:acyl-CoA synthetase (AMP-forming)/AMP-acid ligase II
MALAICVPGSKLESVSYGELERFIYNVARNALKSGLASGNLAAIYVNDTILHTAIVLGLMYVNVATLSLREPKGVSGITPDFVLSDMPGRFSTEATVVAVDQSWLEGEGLPLEQSDRPTTQDNDVCRIILTSGSTGVSKGVAFSHRMLAERVAHYSYSKGSRFAHCSRFFCDLGISTSPGFRYAITLLSRGGTIFFLGPDPADILQAIDLYKIQGMATSPYGLGEFLKFFEADRAFRVTFNHIICQGAMLSRELSIRARVRMCQNLYSSYGSTETTTVAFGPASVLERVPGAVGYIQPGVIVEAVDKTGTTLPPLRDGSLRIRSTHMVTGYVGDPESTQTFFRDGYFYSGDIGHLTPDGLLVITGREKTALNIGGDTVSPELVEAIITSFPGIKEVGVFAANNDLGIAELCALVVTSIPVDLTALRRHCAGKLPPSCIPARIVAIDALPRGGQGKLERHRLPELASGVKPA